MSAGARPPDPRPVDRLAPRRVIRPDARPGTIRLATRGSRLALAQSTLVADALTAHGLAVELVTVLTPGDASAAPLDQLGGHGVFVSSVRDAVIVGDCDIAVHSMKDLPVDQADELVMAAVPLREDPADALCCRDQYTLKTLPPGAVVGTGSPRRAAQLLAHRPDLTVRTMRGNVESRLRRLDTDLDAVVLAMAGLRRIGRTAAVSQRLDPREFVPAAGQGALAIECRADAPVALRRVLALLDDEATRLATTAERAVLDRLNAGCTAPVGALGTVEGGRLTLVAEVLSDSGSGRVVATDSMSLALTATRGTDPADGASATASGGRVFATGPADEAFAVDPAGTHAVDAPDGTLATEPVDMALATDPSGGTAEVDSDGRALATASAHRPGAASVDGPASGLPAAAASAAARALGIAVADRLLAGGAGRIADLEDSHSGVLSGRRILLPLRVPDGLAAALAGAGAELFRAPFTRQIPLPLDEYRRSIAERWDWVVVSSPHSVRLIADAGVPADARIAAVGPATGAALANVGLAPDLVAYPGGGRALASMFPDGPGRVLMPGAREHSVEPAAGLRAKGWEVRPVPIYQTVPERLSAELITLWPTFDAFVVTAGSIARSAVAAAGVPGPPVVAIGEPSAEVAESAGLAVARIAAGPSAANLFAAVVDALTDDPGETRGAVGGAGSGPGGGVDASADAGETCDAGGKAMSRSGGAVGSGSGGAMDLPTDDPGETPSPTTEARYRLADTPDSC